jgi:hypothetical protein
LFPVQHGWVAAPHDVHVLVVVEQIVLLLVQLIPLQQVWEAAPHGAHVPPEHRNPVEHIMPAQQGWPMPPQVPQVPFEQTSDGRLHVVPPQQGCPVPPQVTHLLVAPQVSVARLHWVAPAQHG